MSSFMNELIVSPMSDGKRWKLVEEFRYHVGEYPSKDIINVPEGFITDFASIPRIFWHILPPWGKYGKAAVVHDWLCTTKKRSSNETHKIFYEAMGILGVPWYKRKIMYYAVKVAGPKWK